MAFDDFKTLYCPHCNAPIDMSQGYRPEECPNCNGIIRYTRGGTCKGRFKSIKMPLQVQDALVILMVLLAIVVTIFYLLVGKGH
jgi:hypothetical protein